MGSYTQITMPIEATIASSNANGATPIVRPYSSLRAISYGCDVLSRMCRGWSRERVDGYIAYTQRLQVNGFFPG
jgi:hypothetical protein